MNYSNIMALSALAMDIEKLRVDTVATNIANQHSIQGPCGELYRPKQVISQRFEDQLVYEVVDQQVAPKKEYQPGHPAADKQGFVSYPGVNKVDEITTMLRASRAYEANIKMLNIARTMVLQALSIGEEK